MSYISLTITLARETADHFAEALMEEGALSVSVTDADEGTPEERAIFGEPGATGGLWDRCELTALFANGADSERDADASDAIDAMWRAAAAMALTELNFTQSLIDDQDWVRQTQSQFPPIAISPRITIVPTWHEATNHADKAINIVLDPGAAFGTGSHATTRLCLQWLEQNVTAADSVLDYGTGSGILAIAALKLGAREAMGVDIDAAAVETAQFNATQNNVQLPCATTDQPLVYVADITVANILANPLKVLAPLLGAHTRAGGKLVLAGILDEQADDIIAIYAPWFDLQVWRRDDGWSAIAGVRR